MTTFINGLNEFIATAFEVVSNRTGEIVPPSDSIQLGIKYLGIVAIPHEPSRFTGRITVQGDSSDPVICAPEVYNLRIVAKSDVQFPTATPAATPATDELPEVEIDAPEELSCASEVQDAVETYNEAAENYNEAVRKLADLESDLSDAASQLEIVLCEAAEEAERIVEEQQQRLKPAQDYVDALEAKLAAAQDALEEQREHLTVHKARAQTLRRAADRIDTSVCTGEEYDAIDTDEALEAVTN